ncbi:Formate acetyltransferase 1 [Corynebacterium pseudotuberculosis]|uniref:Formate acetyltransferase n=1 Tax=Corynebacterium pseudotuberculosis (strain C231) TaxID=681645 RepID=D9QE26_CORP2|nr:formate C-acetyltransferase [Corynebacterium pseudotuberculosis]ADK28044.2 formate C-acetyltransferase [Corynebacterium pseudotuberculosis FRC41]ADL09749.1 formate C-acetyltransferase [Corynebacterium pseudotuberculosis C231]ADL20155.1 formate C-acetyltransferase [Corynebacterium pseudotuberculosis 1002]ADO25544.1 formate C-acetyltransferase [Corynebacterium pseudotuberculosis I19]AEK91592.1 Formate acetyltransferase 1 [Corynebacterium pseudotuberculosis PAT10]
MTTAQQETNVSAWEGFAAGPWQEDIDVRDFIQRNYTPYDDDASFLAGPTEKTLRVWDTLEKNYLSVERKKRVFDVDTDTPADIDAFPAGYISEDDNVIVGLQTDVPLKRAMMPFGGWRMVETAIKEAGKEANEDIKNIFTKYRKTHNEAVFDIYTPRIRAARSSHIITGLPDAYGRGRIIGDYRRVALYGVDFLIEEKNRAKDAVATENFSEHWARYREEHSEQIKALKKLKIMAAAYGFDISRPAKTAQEAVQWTYFAYLASVKSQDGAAMSIGRLSAFLDIYFERDLASGLITEEDAQEMIDALVIKLRIVRFLRTIDYDQIFSGDPYWATWSDAGFAEDGRSMVTKTSFRLLQTLRNLGPAPEPNITIFWDPELPEGYKDFCAAISIETSSIQYESDKQIRDQWGDDAAIACCVSPMAIGKQMQFFGARVNSAKSLLYAMNGGRDEVSGKQITEPGLFAPIQGDGPLDFDEVWEKYENMLDWVVGTYIEALNIIHFCHDRYAYESIEMALHDSNIVRTMGCGIAGLAIVADSLSAIKYAKVTPVRDETGLIVDYITEGDFPRYGNDDDRVDDIAATIVHTVMSKIKEIPLYRDAIPTQSVLTITSNVVYGKATGAFPSGHKAGTPFSPGANPENGADTHGMVASMLSVGKLDYQDALDGISLTNTITPSGLGRTADEQVKNLVGILDAGFIMDEE